MEKKSNKFLKVAGILMIIGGGISTILGIIFVLGVGFIGAGGAIMLGAIAILVAAVIQLVAGIIGVANAAKPEKAMVCIVFGLLVLVLSIAGNAITLIGGGTPDIVNILLGVALPILYLIGAFQNKQKAA